MKLVQPLLSLCSNMNEHELVRHIGSDSQGIISAMVSGKFLICWFSDLQNKIIVSTQDYFNY